MPGVFGFYKKSKIQSIDSNQLINDIKETLKHLDTYCSDTFHADGIGIGTISVNNRFHNNIYFDQRNEICVCLSGQIFDFIGTNINQNKINKELPIVIVDLYMQYGKDLPGKISGDYNLVIYDKKNDFLFIFNDRFGYRHLYFYQDKDIIMFSPEMKAFIQYQGFDKSIDEQGLANYFQFFYVMGDNTLFKYVKLLPPASYICIDKKSVEVSTYWRPKYLPRYGLNNISEAIHVGYDLFQKSMERRLHRCENAIIPLSGGLDSRLITGVAKNLGCSFSTVTMGIPECSNHKIAKEVTRALGEKDPVLMVMKPNWIKDYAEDIVWMNECGYASLGLARLYGFPKVVGVNYDCLLNGIFGGHLSFGPAYFNDADVKLMYNARQRTERLTRGLEGNRYQIFLKNIATDRLNEIVSYYGAKTINQEWIRSEKVSDLDIFRQDYVFLYNRIRRAMNAIDLNRNFYNNQLPFASYELYDFYLQLKPELLLNHYLYKEIFKEKLPSLAKIKYQATGVNLYHETTKIMRLRNKLRDRFFWYSGRLGLDLYDKEAEYWENIDYRKGRDTGSWARRLLLGDSFLNRGLFVKQGVENLLKWHDHGGSAFPEISQMIMFELFLRKFID